MSEPLGVRNCNYGNIRYNKFNRWIGLIGENKGFCVFSSPDFGLRALVVLLRGYIVNKHLRSVDKILSRFAPASENNSHLYISHVRVGLRRHGCDPDNIDYRSHSFVMLVHFICYIESRVLVTPDKINSIIKQFNL